MAASPISPQKRRSDKCLILFSVVNELFLRRLEFINLYVEKVPNLPTKIDAYVLGNTTIQN